MSALTPEKLVKLRGLLTSLPGPVTDRLLGQAEIADPALGRLLRYCKTDPEQAARDRFFAPLAPLSHDPETARPSVSRAAPVALDGMWRWIAEDLAPTAADAARARAADLDTVLEDGHLDPYRCEAATAVIDALEGLPDEPRVEKRLRTRLGVDDLSRIREAAVVLRATPTLRTALKDIEPSIADVDDALSGLLRDRYEQVIESDPDAGSWFLYLIMARLQKPWLIMRVFERIVGRGDDFLLSRTEMHSIGDALLEDAEHCLMGFAQAPIDLAAADGSASALSDFASITVGMTREMGIRKDGDWGKALVDLRGRAAMQMEAHHLTAKRQVDRILPDSRRIKAGRWKPVTELGSPEFEQAEAMCRFLHLTRSHASRAAVGGSHQQVITELEETLHEQGAAVLEWVRMDEDADRSMAAAHLEFVARLFEALDEVEAARILVRRGAAAKAA
ncbi:MAG: hypothetical protein AAFX09_00195 [Pseudomonadota bacterium]